ncbi:MAG: DegV family protein [Candidatus Dormiibacterota bacterium]
MSSVQLVCDSTADLDPTYGQANDIAIVPLRVIFGEQELLDGVEISTAEFYRRMRTDRHHPRTSQPTPAEFEEVFRRVAAGGQPVVCTTISAELSGTYSSAVQAREALPDLDIRVVDTRTVGPGHTAAVAVAMALRDQGGDADSVVAALARLRAAQRLVFTVETLEYLRRGGRIGGARAFLGSVLNIKPILAVEDGKVEAVDRVRTYPRALDRLVDEVATCARKWGPTRAIVAHAASPDQARTVADRVAEITSEPPRIVEVGAVLGCHSGPGAFGLAMHAASVVTG